MTDDTTKPPTVVSLSDRRKARLKAENDEFPLDLAERLKMRAETAAATANASKQMLDHVRRVQNALNNACLLRDPIMKASELKLAREELDKRHRDLGTHEVKWRVEIAARIDARAVN